MDINKIEELIKKRISKEIQLQNEIEEDEKNTIKYLYRNIISDIRDEINKLILTYNILLDKYKSPLHIFLYSGNHFSINNLDNTKIVFILKNKKSDHPHSQTLITNFNHCIICFEKERGVENNYYFLSKYFIFIGHAKYEKKDLKLSLNETNIEKIKNELLDFFNIFLIASIEKCSDLKLNSGV
jgi:hypothetical protein